MPSEILVLAEYRDGKLASASREAIGFGQKLARQLDRSVSVLFIGSGGGDLADEVSRAYGVEVLFVSGEWCRNYAPETYCDVISQVVWQRSPFLVLMGHTYQAIDLGPRLATLLNRGFASNCIDCRVGPDRLIFVRPVFGGKLLQQVALKCDSPHFVSLQQGAFKIKDPPPCKSVAVVDMRIEPSNGLIGRRVLEVIREAYESVDLGRAEIIVGGGRGLGSKENFQMIVELARALGGAVGATRPVVDGGWIPKEHQIGVSGQSVAPKLYIACGISGTHQHLVGMTGARCVVAINKDSEAPIFNVAHYGIVGDVFRIVPVLIEMAKNIRGVTDER